MRLLEIVLEAVDPASLREFYTRTLGLEALESRGGAAAVQAGGTRLAFVPPKDPAARPTYHVAFNIPENRLAAGKAWLSARTPLVSTADGRDQFHFADWNADAVYSHDPAGNLLELIARHTLDNASDRPFDGGSLLEASEMAVVVEDVPRDAEAIRSAFGLAYYGPRDAVFTAVGDERGLFIVVERARPWAPDRVRPAETHPIDVTIAGAAARRFELRGNPFRATSIVEER